ncbi:MAG: GNAT family N-acetyltransferase [Aquihabitans sp.]
MVAAPDGIDTKAPGYEALVVDVASPVPAAEWRQAVAADPGAMADHTPEWTGAIARSGWRDASRRYRFADGTSVVLPLLHAGSRHPSGTWAASPPSGRGFGGLVGDGADDPAVIGAVMADLVAQRWLSLRIRPSPGTGDRWARAAPPSASTIRRRAHVIDLRPGSEAVFAAMRKSTRRAIRRHERGDVEVRTGVGGELLETYQLLRRSAVEHWAGAQHEPLWLARRRAAWRDPADQLQATAAALGDRFRVWVASIGGRPCAANIVVDGPVAHAVRAASDRSVDAPSGVMQYLDWLAVEHACRAGSVALNLGESGESSSLGSYKEGLGAVAHDYAEVRVERLPITPVDTAARRLAKRIIGFRDA